MTDADLARWEAQTRAEQQRGWVDTSLTCDDVLLLIAEVRRLRAELAALPAALDATILHELFGDREHVCERDDSA